MLDAVVCVGVVDENGQVTAVAVGDATIIAYATDGVDEKAFIAKVEKDRLLTVCLFELTIFLKFPFCLPMLWQG